MQTAIVNARDIRSDNESFCPHRDGNCLPPPATARGSCLSSSYPHFGSVDLDDEAVRLEMGFLCEMREEMLSSLHSEPIPSMLSSEVTEGEVNSELEILRSHDVLDPVADPTWGKICR